jgi:hypothetical protein
MIRRRRGRGRILLPYAAADKDVGAVTPQEWTRFTEMEMNEGGGGIVGLATSSLRQIEGNRTLRHFRIIVTPDNLAYAGDAAFVHYSA